MPSRSPAPTSHVQAPAHAPAQVRRVPGLLQAARLTAAAVPGLALALVLAAVGLAWGLADTVAALGSTGLLLVALGAALLAGVPLAVLLAKAWSDLEQGRHLALAAGALDPVTGVSARAPFLALAEREFARSRRYGIGAALLLVDVDRFRRLVEGHEAAAGDLVLREIAASTQATLRGADALARFGHAQVAVFLAHADPLGALDVAERIRERVEQLEIAFNDQRLRVTVSVGVVLMRPAHLALQSVIDDAEAALGAARHAGGNCVRSAPVDPRRLAQGSRGPSIDDNHAAGS